MAYKVLSRDPYSEYPKWKFRFKCKTEAEARTFVNTRYADYDEDEYKIIYPGPHGYPSSLKFNNPNNKYFGKQKEYIDLYKLNRI